MILAKFHHVSMDHTLFRLAFLLLHEIQKVEVN